MGASLPPNSFRDCFPENSSRHLLSITDASLSEGKITFFLFAISHTPRNESIEQSKSLGATNLPFGDIFPK